jgi:peptide/nickel transport system substrate-binding protein
MATTDDLGPLTGAMVSRRRMLTGMAGVVALGSVSPLLAACGGAAPPSTANTSGSATVAKKGGTLVIDVKTEPAGYNPLQFPNAHVVWLSGQLYDPLYEYDDSGAVVPNLASGPPTTTDGKTWTVNLKTGVQFHNGDTFTADDVVATMKALATAPTTAFASQVGKIDAISAVSPTQVTFTLAQPNYIIPDVLAILPMLNKNHVKDAKDIIGTGPFKWSELVSGSHITFVANPNYHLGAPLLDKLEFRFVPDANTRVVDLLQKKSNVAMAPTFSTLNKLTESPSVKLLDVPAAVMMPIHINCNSEVFKDPRVRQALGFAMDRTRVVDTVFAGKAVAYRGGAVPPNLRGYDAANPYYPEKADLAKAKSLLAAAGVTTPVRFTANVYNVAESVAAMQVIQQDWAAAGFEVTIQTLDLASWAKILVSKKFDMMISYEYNGTWWGKDGINQLSNYSSASGTNWVNYSDPQFDALLAQSRATQDAGTQTKLWQQMDHMLAVAGVNLIPAVPHLTAGTQTNVVGIPLGRFGLCFLDLRKAGLA